jgi:hypothetical protein
MAYSEKKTLPVAWLDEKQILNVFCSNRMDGLGKHKMTFVKRPHVKKKY